MSIIIRRILDDIQVDLSDEFDQNFERQAFFSKSWERRKSPTRKGGATLIDTGQLRQSIESRITGDSISFFTTLPYAEIHNEGGEIKVTSRMKSYFWARYYGATNSFGRKKNGERSNDRRTVQLATEAEFWKFMALKKVGSTIKIPRRQFIGYSPEVERSVVNIIENNVREYFQHDFKIIK